MDYQHGWFQIAFEKEIAEGLSPIVFARRRLIAVKRGDTIRLFEATCPHRGAHLGYGATLESDHITCAFHGQEIHLGCDSTSRLLCVPEYPCHVTGGMVFIRLSNVNEPDLPAALQEVEQRYEFVPGFTMEIEAPLEVAADNAMDSSHFKKVHGILNEAAFTVANGKFGELRANGEFIIPRMGDPTRPQRVAYTTGAFSPGLVVSEIHGERPYDYVVISTGIPRPEPDRCTIRVTLGLPRPVDQWFSKVLMDYSREGLEKDHAVWKHVAASHIPAWSVQDESARAFMDFCMQFVRTDRSGNAT